MELQDAIIHEKYEWCNIWWDCADDRSLKRVLLIGDSIVGGYHKFVNERLEGVVHVDRMGNSRGVNDPAHYKELAYVLAEEHYEVIHFNNGLHAGHLPDDAYDRGLRHMVDVLERYSDGAKLIWGSSTPIAAEGDSTKLCPNRNPMVVRRNQIAARIMAEHGIPVNDLYTLMLDRPDLRSSDSYHYNTDGQAVQAEAVAKMIREALETSE